MKNICFLNTVEFWGGGEKLFLENAKYFKSKGYAVWVAAAPESPLSKKSQLFQIKTFELSGGNKAFLSLPKRKKLKQFLISNQIDTLIVITSQDAKFGGLVAKKAGVSKIVYQRGLASPIKGSLLNKHLFKNIFTHIVANSQATKQAMLVNINDSNLKERIKVIYHGIDTDHLDAKSRFKSIETLSGEVILGNAGRLTRQKGQEHLIVLAEELKNRQLPFKLYIAGTGELHDELQSTIEEKKLQNHVYLLGFVKEMEAFMNSLDIFVLSSLWEGFGFAIVEAMIKEKPVVAFNTSSNPEIIEDGKTGFLVDYPNMNDFANKVEQLIHDSALRKKQGIKGKERVERYFKYEDRLNELEHYLLDH